MIRLKQLAKSTDAQHGIIMAAATLVAGGFDYLVLLVAVGLLPPAESITFLAIMAILQLAVHGTNVIRNVVAYYTAELSANPLTQKQIGPFVQQSWRWAVRWGAVATAVFLLISPLLSRWLLIQPLTPLLMGSLAILLLFLRPVTDGTLQGTQNFLGLGGVQIMQALLRFGLTFLLIWLGWGAAGGVLALPLAMLGGLGLGLWLLGSWFRPNGPPPATTQISWKYSTLTLLGLLSFALMIQLDTLLVQRLFSPEVAGNYSPVITLGKMNLFVPLGLGLVLFPKATQRHAAGQDPRPVLLLTLAATLLPGFALTAVYFLFPEPLVALIFRGQYPNPGLVLGLVGVATTLFAGTNIWLNYALSLKKRPFVLALLLIVALQAVGMLAFSTSLMVMSSIMIAAGLAGNLCGLFLFRH